MLQCIRMIIVHLFPLLEREVSLIAIIGIFREDLGTELGKRLQDFLLECLSQIGFA